MIDADGVVLDWLIRPYGARGVRYGHLRFLDARATHWLRLIKQKTMPADGWAICVELSVLRPARLKLGVLYTNPRYSARNEKCLVNAYCAPTPYTNEPFVSNVAPAKVPPKLSVGSNTTSPAPARAYACNLARLGSLTTAEPVIWWMSAWTRAGVPPK
jgi:hypothetical protein